jgi:hypothetical protein
MQIIFVNEAFWQFDEGDVARKTTIVPPIGLLSGNAICQAGAVDGGHNEVLAVAERCSHLAIKRREAAFVLADLFAIHPEPRPIIRCSNVQEDALARFRREGEVSLIPEGTFVEEKRFLLRVPIAGYFQRG